jgi:Transport and Golgi organisation 2
MCTVIVSLEPAAQAPLLLLGIRDELAARSWQPPARHWPRSPLIGGRDQQAGGTWLAVHPAIPRVGCVLNGRGEPAPLAGRQSRGEFPLRAAADGDDALAKLHGDPATLAAFDPFHLVCADASMISILSWDGREAAHHELDPGTYVITNAGLDPDDPKVRYFGHRFAAHRPSGDPAVGVREAWEPWLSLAGGDGLPADDPRAIRVRKELPDGRLWGTTSVSLVALTRDGIRYDFQPVPGTPAPVEYS